MEVKQFAKTNRPTFSSHASQQLYTAYLVNILATLNNLNLKMQECNHHIIAFYSSSNVFKIALKSWCSYQKHGVFLQTQ